MRQCKVLLVYLAGIASSWDLDFFRALQFQPRIKIKSLIVEVSLEELRRTRSKKSRFVSRVFTSVTLAMLAIGPSFAWSSEETLRAAFVYNFMKFIQWPSDSDMQAETESDVKLCAIGASPSTRNALGRLQGKKANKRVIHLNYLDTNEQITNTISSCHMVYKTVDGEDLELPEEMPSGVLLVVDEPKKYSPNIGITLTKNSDGRIEFGINQPAITRAGVSISSRLLLLAKQPQFGGHEQ